MLSRVGALLSTSLTSDGVEYLKAECLEDSPVTRFWREQFDWIEFPPIEFDSPIDDGDSIDVDGFTAVVSIEFDDCGDLPWEREDGHGPVSDWRIKESKRPGERILCSDRSSARFYDWQAAIELAKRDGWDAPPYGEGTAGQRAERAVTADFERLRAFCRGDWWYVGIRVRVFKNGIELGESSLWGIESDSGDYLTEIANELLPEALESARQAISSLHS